MNKILYISPYLPYKNIDHAGGKFLYEYLIKMKQKNDITILVPNTALTRKYLPEVKNDFNILLTETVNENKNIFKKIYNIVKLIYSPISLNSHIDKLLVQKLKTVMVLEKYDIVEIHFSQLMSIVKEIKQIDINMPVFIFAYDVLYQSIKRMFQNAPSLKFKFINGLRLIRAKRVEQYYLNLSDSIFVFSNKDRTLFINNKITTAITVVTNMLPITYNLTSIKKKNKIVNLLFIASFNRYENINGILWFLENVWDKIKTENTILYIVGSNPSEKIKNFNSKNIIVTGFVEDINQYYIISDIVIVPLFLGAGVKYKSLEALFFSLPIVSTIVGAEGINHNVFAKVTNDAFEFSTACNELINNYERRINIGKQGKVWLEKNHNFEIKTINSINKIYAQYKI